MRPTPRNRLLATAFVNPRAPSSCSDICNFPSSAPRINALCGPTPSGTTSSPEMTRAADFLRSLSCGIFKPRKAQAVTLPVTPEPTSPEAWLTDSSAELSWTRAQDHAPGFENIAATCYMNCVIQVLLHLPAFDRVLASWPATRSLREHCAHCELVNLRAACVRTSPSSWLSPTELVRNLGFISTEFSLVGHQDAHEYLSGFIQALIRASVDGCAHSSPVRGRMLTPTEETSSRMHEVFGGMMQSVMECGECGATSAREEVFHDLCLDISSADSVDRALSNITEAEQLTGENQHSCEKCACKVDATKLFSIRRAPNVLAIHLKRFSGDQKDNRNVKYADKLDLAPYMFGAPEGTYADYRLSGVVEHDGSVVSGHHVAHVKSADGKWATKNDATSTLIEDEDAFGKQAYILMYSRVPGPRSEGGVKLSEATAGDVADGSNFDVNVSSSASQTQKETMLMTSPRLSMADRNGESFPMALSSECSGDTDNSLTASPSKPSIGRNSKSLNRLLTPASAAPVAHGA